MATGDAGPGPGRRRQDRCAGSGDGGARGTRCPGERL